MAEIRDCGKLCGFPTAGNPDPMLSWLPNFMWGDLTLIYDIKAEHDALSLA
jgi:hypothetical protein